MVKFGMRCPYLCDYTSPHYTGIVYHCEDPDPSQNYSVGRLPIRVRGTSCLLGLRCEPACHSGNAWELFVNVIFYSRICVLPMSRVLLLYYVCCLRVIIEHVYTNLYPIYNMSYAMVSLYG